MTMRKEGERVTFSMQPPQQTDDDDGRSPNLLFLPLFRMEGMIKARLSFSPMSGVYRWKKEKGETELLDDHR